MALSLAGHSWLPICSSSNYYSGFVLSVIANREKIKKRRYLTGRWIMKRGEMDRKEGNKVMRWVLIKVDIMIIKWFIFSSSIIRSLFSQSNRRHFLQFILFWDIVHLLLPTLSAHHKYYHSYHHYSNNQPRNNTQRTT